MMIIDTVRELASLDDQVSTSGGYGVILTARTRFGCVQFWECGEILCREKFALNLKQNVYKGYVKQTVVFVTTEVVVVVVVVNSIKHQNRAITGERVATRAAPSYQYAMVLVIIT